MKKKTISDEKKKKKEKKREEEETNYEVEGDWPYLYIIFFWLFGVCILWLFKLIHYLKSTTVDEKNLENLGVAATFMGSYQ